MSKNVEIFNRTLRLLEMFAKSEKAFNTGDIKNLTGQSLRTAQRTAQLLQESGWLECKTHNNCALYKPTEKTKRLFETKGNAS